MNSAALTRRQGGLSLVAHPTRLNVAVRKMMAGKIRRQKAGMVAGGGIFRRFYHRTQEFPKRNYVLGAELALRRRQVALRERL